MTTLFWTLLLMQIAMGGFDTVFHHEGTERLAWRPSQAGELRLHGVRNLAYAVMFLALGLTEPHGGFAVALVVLMIGELLVTLWDFVEEDRTRHLPTSERITHTLLNLNYGVLLALLVPLLGQWAELPTALRPAWHGIFSILCAVAAAGVVVSGLRDLAAARRAPRLVEPDPAPLARALGERRSVLVTGATGLVGRRLVAALVASGHEVTVLTRSMDRGAMLPAPLRIVTSLDQIAADLRIDAIVNLAGEPIAGMPWTAARRRLLLRSRLRTTRAIVRLVARLADKPYVLVSGSAIGWYGLHGDEPLSETGPGNACFSRRLCVAWEAEARRAEALGVRAVLLRTGLVLAAEGGVLSRMLTPFEFGLGGRFGDGRQWMSWIHRDDLVRLIVHAIATPTLTGPLNGVAPAPVRNRDFTRALGAALRRPAVVPIPAAPLRLALGSFADELLLGGQRVLPEKAGATGFAWLYPDVADALLVIVGGGPALVDRTNLQPVRPLGGSVVTPTGIEPVLQP